ncbi:piggyBac transposable element-derived protein 4-like [Mya arenaria]|uniref:piggyBac transposable element-derived protein 4-like n=1 Tax=Mya arenaria TaxID=6604 RepID=UPI0022E98814|nr:piggyBac transposable element-derived protein 4-like [Mya arenaria]
MASDSEDDVYNDRFVRNLLDSDDDSDDSFDGFDPVRQRRNYNILLETPLSVFGPENNVEIEADREAGWTGNETFPTVMPFNGGGTLNVEMDSHNPIDYMKLFIDNDFFEVMCNETNAYATNRMANQELATHSRMRKWEDVTPSEMKVFFALVIAMGLVYKSDLDDYWTTDYVTETPFFSRSMSRDRFLNILSNFHISTDEDPTDKLRRIRPMIIRTMQRFSKVYTPDENLSFDEATCPWKGRLNIKVYNKNKPAKFGVKLYTVCEAGSGYCLGYDIYAGRQENRHAPDYYEALTGETQHKTKTTCIVMNLMSRCGLLHKGHKVYMDNYYTSPELFQELESSETYGCGTLRVNRVGTPLAIKSKRKLNEGEVVFRRKDNLLAMRYKDKRDVTMLTNFHEANMAVLEKRDYRTGDNVRKPKCIVDYCKHMGGVDLLDQFGHYNCLTRKSKKWWRKLFYYLVNMTFVNSYILYKKFAVGEKKLDHDKFRSAIVCSLLEEAGDVACRQVKRGRPVLGEIPTRMVSRCFPEYIPAKEGAKRARPLRDCVVCNPKKKERDGHKRVMTSFWCPECQVALCVNQCFKDFHTKKNFK